MAAIDDNPPQFPKTQYDFTTTNATGPFTTIGNVGNIIDKDFVLDHKRHTFDTSNRLANPFDISIQIIVILSNILIVFSPVDQTECVGSVDPDETAPNEPSHQYLCCLL